MVDIAPGAPYVFISYASANRARVIEIADCLESSGIGIWFDRSDIPGGTSYGPEIVSGIKNAAVIVLLCSEESLASRNVRQEIQLAWRHERPILPLLLEPLIFPDDVSYWLEGAQWIEVLDDGPGVWLEQVRYALALMGYAGLLRGTPDQTADSRPLIEIPPNNLPSVSGQLIGRDRELRQVKSLLANSRLLTLTGPGGTGKTRLAEEAARDSAALFPAGIWFVDAANAREAQSFVEAIGYVLQIHETPGESLLNLLAAFVHGQQMLLILDNLEQIVGAGTVLDLLLEQDGPTILATSRAPTRSAHELVIPVAPLEVVAPEQDTPASVIGRNPAVQLFVNRAKQVKPDFQLSDGNAFEIASICARLDGLPLAIELAAARSRLLHPAALLTRLDSRLNLLTRGAGRSARQQTLLSAISWSYDLLSPQEQSVFRRLGVFAGGATIEAAEAVVSAVGDDVPQEVVLDSIDTLIDHSLLEIDRSHHDDGSSRIRMLETLREFALSISAELGELDWMRRAHGRHFLAVAEELEPQLEAGQQAMALLRLSADQANLVAAIESLTSLDEHLDQQMALSLVASLWRFWWMRGNYSEGGRLIERALSAGAAGSSEARARALNGAGVMAFSVGNLTESKRFHESAAALSAELGLELEAARSLDNLGIVALVSGDVSAAAQHFESALNRYRETNDRRGMAVALDHLSAAEHAAGNLDQAHALATESLEAWRKLGDQQAIGQALQQLGVVAMYSGQYEIARDYYRQAVALAETQEDPTTLANALLNLGSATELLGEFDAANGLLVKAMTLFRQVSDTRSIGYTEYMLGHVARQMGNADIASAHLTTGLELLESAGQRDAVALCFETLGGVCVDRRDYQQAAQFFGSAQAIREQTGVPVPGTRVEELASDSVSTQSELGQEPYQRFLELGRTMTHSELLREAPPTER